MNVGEQIIESLNDFVGKLKRGERIIVKTVMRCVCNEHRAKTGNPKCEQCGGRGWLIDAKTLFGEETEIR